MARVTPEEFQEKHARRLKASLDDVRAGVNRVTESPTLKAAAKKDKMVANLTAAVQSGKWEAGLRRVDLPEWKSKMLDKGVNRIPGGIDAAAPKVKAFAADLLPHVDRVRDEVMKLPDLTLDDNIRRAETMIRGMSKFKRS